MIHQPLRRFLLLILLVPFLNSQISNATETGFLACDIAITSGMVAAGTDTEYPTFGFTDATTISLYNEDFESPIVTPISQTNPRQSSEFFDLDATPISTLFAAVFSQTQTVETVLWNGTDNQYTDMVGTGGEVWSFLASKHGFSS